MSLIEELLKYSKQHCQSVMIILLGIIIMGSIAGGLWIQNLNSILAEKKELENQRLSIIEERYRNTVSELSLAHEKLVSNYENLDLIFSIYKDSILTMTKQLYSISHSNELNPKYKTELQSVSKLLSELTVSASNKFKDKGKNFIIESESLRRMRIIAERPASGYLSSLVLVISLVFIVILFYMILRRKRNTSEFNQKKRRNYD